MKNVTNVGIGIDFGTTNSTAAVFDGERVSLIQLETDSPIMPSATYIDADLQTITGQAAIDRYIEGNTGRTVELVPEVIGRATLAVGAADPSGQRPAETLSQAVYGSTWAVVPGHETVVGKPKRSATDGFRSSFSVGRLNYADIAAHTPRA